MKFDTILTLAIALILYSALPIAVAQELSFEDPALENRYRELINQIRCLQCEGQTIADSNAELASDLRRKTRALLADGMSNQEVRHWMIDRYGETVLYNPRLSLSTLLLWMGPLLVLIIVGARLLKQLQRRDAAADARSDTESLSDEERGRLDALLEQPVTPSTSDHSTSVGEAAGSAQQENR